MSATTCSARAAASRSPTRSVCRCCAQIPLEPAVRAGGDDGVPVMVADPETPASQAIAELARALVRTGKPDPAQRMTRRLQVL